MKGERKGKGNLLFLPSMWKEEERGNSHLSCQVKGGTHIPSFHLKGEERGMVNSHSFLPCERENTRSPPYSFHCNGKRKEGKPTFLHFIWKSKEREYSDSFLPYKSGKKGNSHSFLPYKMETKGKLLFLPSMSKGKGKHSFLPLFRVKGKRKGVKEVEKGRKGSEKVK